MSTRKNQLDPAGMLENRGSVSCSKSKKKKGKHTDRASVSETSEHLGATWRTRFAQILLETICEVGESNSMVVSVFHGEEDARSVEKSDE
ncbi:hypothetical protein [Rhizobium tumorigenes]|uniref:Uncharacterized protein n=1 Tax=Rhizobium tumorigenes TaxID=2041385 RepID=A0AAF1KA92_9HYPH|nr:hypothetical protein [Rhizobium tumorigenes]WFR95717.1 hypothetical protein PR017_00770 [Rhizobium tumorigenes]